MSEFTLKLDPIRLTATVSGIPIGSVDGLAEALAQIIARIEALESGTVAPPPELEPTKLSGTPFGTEGFYEDNTSLGYASVFDGDINTFFDSTTADNAMCGLMFDSIKNLHHIRYHPRIGEEKRIPGGKFQYLNNGNWIDFHIAPEALPMGWVQVSIEAQSQGIRYISPAGGYGNIAEIEVYGV